VIALVLSVVFSVGFGHVMKWSERRRAYPLWVGAWNYIGGSAACALITLTHPPAAQVPFTIVTGAWGGVSYLVSLLYYFTAVSRLGVGLATATVRLAVAIPVAVALLVWHEPVDLAQAAGLVLVLLALPLLSGGGSGGASGHGGLILGLIAPLFLITGVGQLAARVYSGGAPAANIFLYLTCLFAGAGVAALVTLWWRPAPLQRRDLLFGLLLGAANVGSNLFLLQALRVLPSAVVFAVSSSAGVVVAAVSGQLLWHERLRRPAVAGVALASVAVVLLTR
jgi:drug/metabolite transporter (DMT)-like permease